MSAFVVGAVPFLIPDEESEKTLKRTKETETKSKTANGEKEAKLTKNQLRVSESKWLYRECLITLRHRDQISIRDK